MRNHFTLFELIFWSSTDRYSTKFNMKISKATLIYIVSLTLHLGTVAQIPNFSMASHFKAISLVNDGMNALGGLPKTKEIVSLYIEYNGQRYMDGQSLSFNLPLVPLPFQNTVLVDLKRDRVVNELVNRYLGGYVFHMRSVFNEKEAFNYDVLKSRFSRITEMPITAKNTVKNDNILRHLPNFVLKTALEKKLTLRYMGVQQWEDKTYEVVSFPYSANLTIDLFFDPQTKLLSRYSFYTDHFINGNQQVVYAFPDYQSINGIKFPTAKEIYVNGTLLRIERLEKIVVNDESYHHLFDRPSGYETEVQAQPIIRSIGKNVYIVDGLNGNNPLILNFKDHLVMVEAPNGVEEAMAMAKRSFPGKPIKKVLITHYHDDHAGRLDHYINNGIPVLTTEGNIDYIRHFTNAEHAVISSGMEKNSAIVESFIKKKTLKDDSLHVELMDFGPNSHANELVVLYFPKERILYQSDMLISNDQGGIVKPLIPINLELYKKIKEHKLQVDTIYGFHLKPVSFKEFEKAVKEMSEWK